jgi:hypothetical protein
MGSQAVSRRTFDESGRAPSGAKRPRTLPKTMDVLPADLGEPEPEVFPLRERLRFRDNLGLGLRDVRQRPAFATLPRGPWLVFIAVACYWQSNAEAWPSQETSRLQWILGARRARLRRGARAGRYRPAAARA